MASRSGVDRSNNPPRKDAGSPATFAGGGSGASAVAAALPGAFDAPRSQPAVEIATTTSARTPSHAENLDKFDNGSVITVSLVLGMGSAMLPSFTLSLGARREHPVKPASRDM